jgi:hypothetical protein
MYRVTVRGRRKKGAHSDRGQTGSKDGSKQRQGISFAGQYGKVVRKTTKTQQW